MKAMILAAGLGKRMQPLTANLPKPLLPVGDKTLIEYQVMRLHEAGIEQMVINHYYLGDKIEDLLGDGSGYGVSIEYSRETVRLETAGGIIQALPLLQDDCFVVVNADVWTEFPYQTLQPVDGNNCLAHLVMVPNREHHPYGDFCIDELGRVHEDEDVRDVRLTFSGISVLHRNLFAGFRAEPLPLVPLLRKAMKQNQVTGEIYHGVWVDVGTPERLQQLNDTVSMKQEN